MADAFQVGPGRRFGLQSVRKRRGLTQAELAKAAGLSVSLIRKLEQGTMEDVRLETARKLAVALRVQTTVLVTGPDREEADPVTIEQWDQVRAALSGLGTEISDAARPTAGDVCAAITEIRPVLARNRFAQIRPMLPGLIRDTYALDRDDEASRQARFQALNMTAWVLTQVRQWEIAQYTLDLAEDAACVPLDRAAVAKTRIWLLLRQGDLTAARDTAIRWADQIEPRFSRATTAELSLWGDFLCNIANAAIRDNRPGEAADALRLARAAGDSIGREVMSDPSTTRVFGPATVAYRRAETCVIDGNPEKALAIAASIPDRVLPAADMSRLRHRLDVANAHAMLKQYEQSFATLREIMETAPEWIVQQRYARDVMGRIISRRRTLPAEMRTLADMIAVPY